jgi:hypothetical protein
VEDKETLQARAASAKRRALSIMLSICSFPIASDEIEITHFHSTCEKQKVRTVGRGIFFASDHGLWVETAAIFASAHLVDDVRLKIDVK